MIASQLADAAGRLRTLAAHRLRREGDKKSPAGVQQGLEGSRCGSAWGFQRLVLDNREGGFGAVGYDLEEVDAVDEAAYVDCLGFTINYVG